MIVSWPQRIAKPGVCRQYAHAVDIVPTIYEALGVEPPEAVKGYTQYPIEGTSFAATFADPEAKTAKQTQFYSMGGTQGIWHQGWKAAAVSPSAPDMWADYANQRWELFDTENDPTECHDLAAEHPTKLKELIALWWTLAGHTGRCPSKTGTSWRSLRRSDPRSPSPAIGLPITRAAPRCRSPWRPTSATVLTRSPSK